MKIYKIEREFIPQTEEKLARDRKSEIEILSRVDSLKNAVW
jgi:hypothetical protein